MDDRTDTEDRLRREVVRLRRTNEAMRRIMVAVEQGMVAVLITDAQGRIEYVNPRFTELTGYSSTEALGRTPAFLKSGQEPPEFYARLWATISSGETWKGEFRNRKKDGGLFWEAATIAPIRDREGRIVSYVGIKEDITERRQAQQDLCQLNEELEARVRRRTARLEAANAELDAFSYSVSHDLRAPLRGIDGFSAALEEEFGAQLGPEAQHYLQRIRAGTLRMGQLIDDLLRLSRVSRGPLNRQRLDLGALARGLMAELRQQDPSRTLDFEPEEGLWAWGDPGLLRSVLENLLGNAWKYTGKQPAARIELCRADLGDGAAGFQVRDNGAGFDMAYAGKLFTAFQRLHGGHEFEGTGIGLALVRRIVGRHGGLVRAEGAVGQGASFSFSLPGPA